MPIALDLLIVCDVLTSGHLDTAERVSLAEAYAPDDRRANRAAGENALNERLHYRLCAVRHKPNEGSKE